MLKYTLGALAAMIILITAGFVILAQVVDGGADTGPAQPIIVSAADSVVWPLEIYVEADQIIDLQFQNHSTAARHLAMNSADVEQLPEPPMGEDPPPTPSEGILISAPAGGGDSAYVRFEKPGSYDLNVAFTGSYYPPEIVTVVVR